MKKILVISDTHRENYRMMQLLEGEEAYDMVIHCGDAEGAEDHLRYEANCPSYVVKGNNDIFSDLPREVLIEIEGKRVWITHGHNYYVSMGPEMIVDEARSRDIDVVMYGHTHHPLIETIGGVLAINPGSLTYPRQQNRRPSYVVIEVDEQGDFKPEIHYL